MNDESSGAHAQSIEWETLRARLQDSLPSFYELEPGGALMMDLGNDGWLLEITPDGRLLCQMGMDMEDLKSLMSEGTPEDLGTDEVAKQAKYYLQPSVAKHRHVLQAGGFEESTEMNDDYVATTFAKAMDLQRPEEVERTIHWCRKQFGM